MAISTPVDIGSIATSASAGTQAFNTTAIVPSAARIWVCVAWFVSVSQTLSNITGGSLTWNIDQQNANGSVHFAVVSADAPAGLASGTTLTANFSGSVSDRMMGGSYSTGVQTGVGAAYGSTGAGDTALAWSSTSATVNNGDILIGGSHSSQASGSPTDTASGGNTEQHDVTSADGDSMTDLYQAGTGASIAAQGTWTGSAPTNRNGFVAYSAAAAAVAPPARTDIHVIYMRRNV